MDSGGSSLASPHSRFGFYVIEGNAASHITLLLQVGGPHQAEHTDFILKIRMSSVADMVVMLR